ncbi:TPA: SIR2 family protein [Vibrio parahaemolyticus]
MLGNGLDLSELSHSKVDLDDLVNRVKTGNAILFTGAGFSLDSEKLNGGTPPLASHLAEQLCLRFNMEVSHKLNFVSDMCIKYGDKDVVLDVLRENFLLKRPSEANIQICRMPWRRIYTTNYDNSIELACAENGIAIDAVSLIDKPHDYIPNRNTCVHLNGSIVNAVKEDLDYKIRLSDSSYMSADFFLDSKWRSVFRKDLEHCSAIVFVGYSLYDIAIQKILFDAPHLIEKTFFITHAKATFEETYKLSEFGGVSKIGTEGLGELLSNVALEVEEALMPVSFTQRLISEEEELLDDFATRELLLYGQYNHGKVDKSILSNFDIPYMFKRECMGLVVDTIKGGHHVLIHSDLGNGKSIFLEHMAAHLAQGGNCVWQLTNFDGNLSKDLDLLSKEGEHIIILDDICNHEDFLDYFSAIKPQNIVLLMADRTVSSFGSLAHLTNNDIEVRVFSVDTLEEEEKAGITEIIDDQNLWRDFTGLPLNRKLSLINDKYNNQISSLLVGLLNSPDIKNRIQELVSEMTENEKYKKTLLAIALCDIFNIRKDSNNIADIAGNEEVFTAKFRNLPSFNNLYSIARDNSIACKSSVLSLFIMNNFFSDTYVVESCLEIMQRIDGDEAPHLDRLHRKLRTFHNVEKLIPQKQNSLNNYFVELKRHCTWLRYHPHYWVQYAMCRLSFGDTGTAQEHLDSAYKYADQRDGYHTENIDTQQARLYIMDALTFKASPKKAFSLFEKADILLNSVVNDHHKFRQVLKYEEIYRVLYPNFSKGNKAKFEHACKSMIQAAEKVMSEADPTQRMNFARSSQSLLSDIVSDIVSQR